MESIKTIPARYWIIIGLLTGILVLLFIVSPTLGWIALILVYPGLIFWVITSYRDSTQFLSQLASLLNAGYELREALGLMRSHQPIFAKRLDRVITDLDNGSGFAESCRRRIPSFPKQVIRVIEQGEEWGELPRIIWAWLEYRKTQSAGLKDIINVLVYVLTVFLAGLLVAVFMFIFVVPVFDVMFADIGKALPAMTQFTINVGLLFKNVLIWVILLAAAAYIAYKIVRQKGLLFPWQQKFDTLLFIRLIQATLNKNVSLDQTLARASRVPKYPGYQSAARSLGDSIRNGDSWTDALEKHPGLPPDLATALASGSSAGDLEESLGQFYVAYRDLYSYQMLAWTGRLALALVLFNGIFFGFIIISMYLPIFQIGSMTH